MAHLNVFGKLTRAPHIVRSDTHTQNVHTVTCPQSRFRGCQYAALFHRITSPRPFLRLHGNHQVWPPRAVSFLTFKTNAILQLDRRNGFRLWATIATQISCHRPGGGTKVLCRATAFQLLQQRAAGLTEALNLLRLPIASGKMPVSTYCNSVRGRSYTSHPVAFQYGVGPLFLL